MNMFIFHNQLRKAYQSGWFMWSFDDYIRFFELFFRRYKKRMYKDHLNISTDNLVDIMGRLPTITMNGYDCDFGIEEYEEIVNLYFDTDLDCDYSIYHFMSGDIRAYRAFELQLY